jgi:hypothetical protein
MAGANLKLGKDNRRQQIDDFFPRLLGGVQGFSFGGMEFQVIGPAEHTEPLRTTKGLLVAKRKNQMASLGDENTKKFHATATIKHNKNAIMILRNGSGEEKFSHEDKAQILWEAYKDRLGTSEFSHIYFDLSQLLFVVPDLEQLQSLFLKEEIDNIIVNLPSGKSPGPDGFNTDFMKKCWRIIAGDFYELCKGFYGHLPSKYKWILHCANF